MRQLLSIAVSQFQGPLAHAPLPFVSERHRELVTAATSLGFEVAPTVIDLSAGNIGVLVSHAIELAKEEAGAGGQAVLVVHVISHGQDQQQAVCVVGADGKAYSATSLDSWIKDSAQADPQATGRPWVLFLVDVCQAGLATTQPWQMMINDDDRRVWVIAGCQADRPGFNGWFTKAAAEILSDLSALDISPVLEFVPLPAIAKAIRRRVDELSDGWQRVVATRTDIAAEDASTPFFPNPGYRRSAAAQVSSTLREFVLAVDDLVDPWHFASRAAGTPSDPDSPLVVGYFHGRRYELSVLSGWLATDADWPSSLRIVTGSPGVGKSALLGMLICAAHPALSTPTRPLWWSRRSDLPEATIQQMIAIHARERDVASVLASVGRQLDLSPATVTDSEAFENALKGLKRQPALVVDAIDEAVNPSEMAEALIKLTRIRRTDGSPALRILVGMRSGSLWEALHPLLVAAGKKNIVNLDNPVDSDLKESLTAYVDDLLRAHHTYASQTLLGSRKAIAAAIAARLVEKTHGEGPRWGEFLVAGLYARSLTLRPALKDPDEAARIVGSEVPTDLPRVIELDLAAQRSVWVRPVLAVLAHSFGDGMPRALIRACVEVFAPAGLERPTDTDIVNALHAIRFYLRRDVDADGVSLYRLFHEALTDHLQVYSRGAAQTGLPSKEDHRRMFEHLLAECTDPHTRNRDWRDRAVPYILRHAIDHAAASGRADELLHDTEFYVHADPINISRHLSLARTSPSQRATAVYRRSLQRHLQVKNSPHAHRSILAIDALRCREQQFADRLLSDTASQGYRPLWATGDSQSAVAVDPQSAMAADFILRHEAAVHNVGLSVASGRPLLVVADIEQSLHVWEIDEGIRLHTLRGHTATIVAIACTHLDGLPVAVTASRDHTVRIWDLSRGKWIRTLEGPSASIDGLACVIVDGRTLAVTRSFGHPIRIWDVGTGMLWQVLDQRKVSAVACSILNGQPVVVAADYDKISVWDLRERRLTHSIDTARSHARTLACATVDGRQVIVAGCDDRVIRIWGMGSGQLLGTLTGHKGAIRELACIDQRGAALAVTSSFDNTIRLWALTEAPRSCTLSRAVMPGPLALGRSCGGEVVAAVIDGTVQVMKLPATTAPPVEEHTGRIWATACGDVDGKAVGVTGGWDQTVRVWDLAGRKGLRTFTKHTANVQCAACTVLDGRPLAVTGSWDTSLHVWDLTSGQHLREMRGHTDRVMALACTVVDDRVVAVTIGADQLIRVWDLSNGEQVQIIEDRLASPYVVACTFLDGKSAVVTGAKASYGRSDASSAFRVWDLKSGQQILESSTSSREVDALACTYMGGRPVLLGAGRDPVRAWDLSTGELIYTLPCRNVVAIACTQLDSRTVLVTGGDDQNLRVWDAESAQEQQVIAFPSVPRSLSAHEDGWLLAAFDSSAVILQHRPRHEERS